MAIDWNRNQPIVKYLRVWLPRTFPLITRVGGYLDRERRKGGFSMHSEGRAADIYLNAFVPAEREIGDGLFTMFRRYAKELGLDHVIWNTRIWSVDKDSSFPWVSRLYTGGGPHTDHIHAAFTRTGSQLQPSILIPLLDGLRLRLYGNLSGEPSIKQPTLDELMKRTYMR